MELESLVLLILIIVASWCLSLLLTYTVWNAWKAKFFPQIFTYCTRCTNRLEQIGFPDEAYEPVEERLGFRSLRNDILNNSRLGVRDGLLDSEGPGSEQDWEEQGVQPLDRGTEVSRSFKGSFMGSGNNDEALKEVPHESKALNRTKLSQVRVLASPSPGAINKTPVNLTPMNAARSSRRRRGTEVFIRNCQLARDITNCDPQSRIVGSEEDICQDVTVD